MGWAEETDRWFQRMVAVAVLALGALSTRDLTIASVTVLALMVLAALRLATNRGSALDILLMTGALLIQTFEDHRHTVGSGGDAHPGYLLLVGTLLVTLAVLPFRPAWLTSVAILAVYVATHVGRVDPLGLALEVIAAATTAAGTATVLWGLRRSAARSDEAAAHQNDVRRATEDRHAAADARIEARRLMHDHLIGALALVQTRTDPRVAASAATSALAALDATTATGGEPGWTLTASTLGIDVAIEAPDREVGADLPPDVITALFDAAHEALRNVVRHAGVDTATVRVSGGPADVTIEVIDDGVGFDLAAARGFGLDVSVRSRVAEVGGTTEIVSAVGEGTTVRLHWAASPRAARTNASRWLALKLAVTDLRIIVWGYPLFLMLGQVAMLAAHPGPRPAASHGLGLAVLVLSGLLLRRAVRAPLSTPLVWICVVAPPPVVLLGLSLAEPGALLGFESWIVGMCEAPLVVLALVGPVWAVVGGAVLYTGAVLGWAAHDATLVPTEVLAVATQPALHALIFLLAAFAITRVGGVATRTREELTREVLHDQRIRLRRDYLTERLGEAEFEVRSLLSEVADGSADPTDPAVARQAGMLAQRLRDELTAPGALDPVARVLVDHARWSGTSVALRTGTTSPDEVAAISAVVAIVLRPRLPRAIVITRRADGRTGIIVTITPSPGQDRRHELGSLATRWDVTLDGDDEIARIRLATGGPDGLPHEPR